MWQAFKFVIRFTRMALELRALPGPYPKRLTQLSALIRGLVSRDSEQGSP